MRSSKSARPVHPTLGVDQPYVDANALGGAQHTALDLVLNGKLPRDVGSRGRRAPVAVHGVPRHHREVGEADTPRPGVLPSRPAARHFRRGSAAPRRSWPKRDLRLVEQQAAAAQVEYLAVELQPAGLHDRKLIATRYSASGRANLSRPLANRGERKLASTPTAAHAPAHRRGGAGRRHGPRGRSGARFYLRPWRGRDGLFGTRAARRQRDGVFRARARRPDVAWIVDAASASVPPIPVVVPAPVEIHAATRPLGRASRDQQQCEDHAPAFHRVAPLGLALSIQFTMPITPPSRSAITARLPARRSARGGMTTLPPACRTRSSVAGTSSTRM